mgnify:CR=1 FL=1
MNKLPTNYSKKDLVEFLNENGIRNGVIERIKNLPETLDVDDKKYDLNIIASWHSEGDTRYEFEMNYYSPDTMEFLFKYKIFNSVENCLNFIEHEMENLN